MGGDYFSNPCMRYLAQEVQAGPVELYKPLMRTNFWSLPVIFVQESYCSLSSLFLILCEVQLLLLFFFFVISLFMPFAHFSDELLIFRK